MNTWHSSLCYATFQLRISLNNPDSTPHPPELFNNCCFSSSCFFVFLINWRRTRKGIRRQAIEGSGYKSFTHQQAQQAAMALHAGRMGGGEGGELENLNKITAEE